MYLEFLLASNYFNTFLLAPVFKKLHFFEILEKQTYFDTATEKCHIDKHDSHSFKKFASFFVFLCDKNQEN